MNFFNKLYCNIIVIILVLINGNIAFAAIDNKFNNVSVYGYLNVSNATLYVSGGNVQIGTGNDAVIYNASTSSLHPNGNAGADLGIAANNWSSIYVNTIRPLKNALTFYGTGSMIDFTGTGAVTNIQFAANNGLQIRDSNANNYIFMNNSNVGIGTANPTEKLHVMGNATINNTLFITESSKVGIGVVPASVAGVTNMIRARATNTGDATLVIEQLTGQTGVGIFGITSGGGTSFTLDHSGNIIGVGSTPSLQSKSTSTSGYGRVETLNSGSEALQMYMFGNAYGGTEAGVSRNSLGLIYNTGAGGMLIEQNTDDSIHFATGATPTVKMTINTSGNVGIGTISPDWPLQLVKTGVQIQASNWYALSEFTPDESTKGVILGYDNSATVGIIGARGAGGSLAVWTINNAGTALERLRIDGNTGNVGINTTTPKFALDVNGKINATGIITNNATDSNCVQGEIRGNATDNKICLCTTIGNWKCVTVS